MTLPARRPHGRRPHRHRRRAGSAPTTSRRRRAAAPPAGVVDPMQWWGALTQQFTQLAAQAMKDGATDAAKQLAGAMVKQSLDAAGKTLKKAADGAGRRRAHGAPTRCEAPPSAPRRRASNRAAR